jgi:hypothetical protein
LTAAQVVSRTSIEALALAGRQFFSSHPWFFGPLPVKPLLTGSPRGLAMRVPSHPTQVRRMLNSRLKRLAPGVQSRQCKNFGGIRALFARIGSQSQ